MKDTYI